MRWPFMNWLRGAPGGDDPAPGAPEATPSTASDPGSEPRIEARPAAWRDLPPVQRTVGAAPLTAPSTAFARDLASRRAPDPILQPLGHDVTADGPAGLVSGIAVPLVQRALSSFDAQATPPLPKPMVPVRGRPTAQRAATTVATLPGRGAADIGPGAGVDAPGPGDAGAEAPVDTAPEGPAGVAPGPALRVLPVARLATETSGIAATRVADATAPLPIQALARVVAPDAPSERDGGTSLSLPAATGVAGDAAAAEPVAGELPPGARADGTNVAQHDVSRTDDPANPVVARRTLGESRRLGLGAPLVGPPPSAARDTGRSDLPVARRARSGDAQLPTPEIVPALPVMAPAAAASAPLPRLVVARRSVTASATTIAPAPAASPPIAELEAPGAPGPHAQADGAPPGVLADSSVDADAAATHASAAGSTRRLVGEPPIGVARLARDDPGTDDDTESAGEPGVGALRPAAMWTAVSYASRPAGMTGTGPTSAATIGGPETAGGSDIAGRAAVQRTTAAPGGDGPSGPARTSPTMPTPPAMAPLVATRAMRSAPTVSIAGLAHHSSEDPAPVLARLALESLGLALFDSRGVGGEGSPGSLSADHPRASSAPGVAVRREERPVVARAALSSGRRPASDVLSTLPLTRAAAGPAGPDAIPTDRPDGAASWTPGAGFTTVAPTPGPFVQRAVQIDEVTVTPAAPAAGGAESGAAAAGQAGPTGASAAGAGGAGTDYEELAEHVYDRIRARLTTELLLDRERSGTLVDG